MSGLTPFKRLLCLVSALILLSGILAPIALAYNGNVIVYVTDTGSVYHRENCTYLISRRAITLAAAVDRGYSPCSRCHPPILGQDRETDNDPYIPPEDYYPGYTAGSGGSHGETSGDKTSDPVDEVEEEPVEEPVNQKTQKKKSTWPWFEILMIVLIYGIPFIGPLVTIGSSAIGYRRKMLLADKAAYEQRRAELLEKYANKSLDDFAPIPPGVYLDSSGHPISGGLGKWGRDFTFYVSKSGKSFHCKSTCTKGANIPIHALDTFDHAPCKRCKPVLPDLTWYHTRQAIKAECRCYDINIPEHPFRIESPEDKQL